MRTKLPFHSKMTKASAERMLARINVQLQQEVNRRKMWLSADPHNDLTIRWLRKVQRHGKRKLRYMETGR